MSKIAINILLLLIFPITMSAQSVSRLDSVDISVVNTVIEDEISPLLRIAPCGIAKHYFVEDCLTIELNPQCGNLPFRREMIERLYQRFRSAYETQGVSATKIKIVYEGKPIEELVPIAFGGEVQRDRWAKLTEGKRETLPLITPLDRSAPIGVLTGRHIALWHSHGYFYDNKKATWRWQRPIINGTVEDMLTISYVVPYLAPMLEHSGAIVLMPHERDFSDHEYIIDNDGGALNRGRFSKEGEGWKELKGGFAYTKERLRGNDNPFNMGTTAKVCSSVRGSASARWQADIDSSGYYAVYVAYRTVANSVDDALYTVHHAGGESTFKVNQTMGGGTWIYLGKFSFTTGEKWQGVSLSNKSRHDDRIVTADAVKIGGGMGNIERSMPGSTVRIRGKRRRIPATPYITSGLPRYAEGARYWMQWAGIPDSIFNSYKGKDDYVDDYKSRAIWVSYLTGGTAINPQSKGLNIPIDLSLAIHTDAGKRVDNKVFGTLGIYNSKWGNGFYPSGISRGLARELTDIIQSYIVDDIRYHYNKDWVRRGMWDRNYSEATWGSVPGMLLELLSHENVADMRYAHDPDFKFTVSRSIYKGLLRFLSTEYNLPYVVHPLPVRGISADVMLVTGKVCLSWSPTIDELEATAMPTHYILYTAVGDGVYDKGRIVKRTSLVFDIDPGLLYRFKVVAVNAGGHSFPSEEVVVATAGPDAKKVMIVNGFDKVSGPEYDPETGQFGSPDSAIPYFEDVAYIDNGALPVRRRGNTFDYAAIHANALLRAGYSVASTSRAYLSTDPDILKGYDVVDLIFGRQKAISPLTKESTAKYSLFDKDLMFAIESFLLDGKSLVLSGAYLASDLGAESHEFTREVLGYAALSGEEDSISPVASAATIAIRMPDKEGKAIYFSHGDTKVCAIDFSIEGLHRQQDIDHLLQEVVKRILNKGK